MNMSGYGDPIMGYSTDSGTICRDCANDNPELADLDPREVELIMLSDIDGESTAYPVGFTCTGCGETIGDWGYQA